MDPALAYGIETAAEGTVGAAIAVAKPTMPLKAKWEHIPVGSPLPRSSHTLSVVKGRAYIFGGEVRPREPVDNTIHIYTLPSSSVAEADYRSIPANGDDVPPPRVGHTASVIGDRIYIFGGRGGKEMKPLDERGRVWVFDTMLNTWSHIDPVEGSQYPDSRSYHASAANEHPLPTKPPATTESVGSAEIHAYGTLFIHGGCPESGRLADVWSFDIAARFWSRLPDAPGPSRGGPCLAFSRDRLYRFGGFDGEYELGGQIDYLELAKSTFDDKGGKGELALVLRSGKWETITFDQGTAGPGNRSMAGLIPITTGQGRHYLVLVFGEGNPSSIGHDGAGKFWDDVWSYQLRPEGMTAASFKDATRQLVGAKTSEGTWARVEIPEAFMADGVGKRPSPRGWFASSQGEDMDNGSIILWGGLNSKNERESDGWILNFNL